MATQTQTQLILTETLPYGRATKTKPILAKPMNCLLRDERVMAKFLLATLEGTQMLKANSMVCLGSDNDVWQQAVDKLHKQYVPVNVDPDGWTTFQPKPENVREYAQVTGEEGAKFVVEAQWGERQADGSFLQIGTVGDYILRNSDPDHGKDQNGQEDVWIVARKVFESTYDVVNPCGVIDDSYRISIQD